MSTPAENNNIVPKSLAHAHYLAVKESRGEEAAKRVMLLAKMLKTMSSDEIGALLTSKDDK